MFLLRTQLGCVPYRSQQQIALNRCSCRLQPSTPPNPTPASPRTTYIPCRHTHAGGGNAGSMAAPTGSSSSSSNISVSPYSHLDNLGPLSSGQLVGFDGALLQLSNVLEASLRSCSVLIERFHHSLFLYVLTGLNVYVSVERYIGPLVALICVLVLQVRGVLGGEGVERGAVRGAG